MNFSRKLIDIIILMSIIISVASCCLLFEYKYINYFEHFSISCTDNQSISLPNLTNDNKLIFLKLEVISGLKFIIQNKDVFTKIKLYSLDIKNIQNSLESFMGDLDSFNNLKELILSNNKMSIIKTRQFRKLTSLIKLDLSYNEIFYFEEHKFLYRYRATKSYKENFRWPSRDYS